MNMYDCTSCFSRWSKISHSTSKYPGGPRHRHHIVLWRRRKSTCRDRVDPRRDSKGKTRDLISNTFNDAVVSVDVSEVTEKVGTRNNAFCLYFEDDRFSLLTVFVIFRSPSRHMRDSASVWTHRTLSVVSPTSYSPVILPALYSCALKYWLRAIVTFREWQ
jgi:hypothetical protein